MLPGTILIDELITAYPGEWRSRVRDHFMAEISRDRIETANQLAALFDRYGYQLGGGLLRLPETPPQPCPLPPAISEQVAYDLKQIRNLNHHWLCSQVQMELSNHHECSTLRSLRSDIDTLLLCDI